MNQNNHNRLNNMFAPLQSMNLNLGNPKKCEKHQKPLSFYNKYKPEKDPICFDCLILEAKELNPPNLYLPFTNLEQDFYFQKKSLMQIIEQANDIKKYERHISNFQQLLTRYFSQFISRFIKEKIFSNVNNNKRVYDFLEKSNILSTSSIQEIMTILSKFENEKFILENKCADVFCQINSMQKMFLKNHKKIENGFRDLLLQCFEDKEEANLDSNQKDKENKNDEGYLYKTQSNKKNPDIMNCVNMENEYYSKSNISAPCSSKNEIKFSPHTNINASQDKNINQISPNDKQNKNININSANDSSININMEKERIFDESPQPKYAPSINQKKDSLAFILNESPKKISPEPQKKREDDNLIYRDHKEKINSLIEKDKNKNINQSFYHQNKSNIKKKSKLNRTFHKFNKTKFGQSHKKNLQYKQYNQFVQKKCKICSALYTSLENNLNDDNICQNCRLTIDEVEDRNDRNNKKRNKRDLSYQREPRDFHKYGRQQKNYVPQNKRFLRTSASSSHFWNKSKNNFKKNKIDSSFNSSHFSKNNPKRNSSHNSLNFISRQINNRMNSPKPFRKQKTFREYQNPKFRTNKDMDKKNNISKDNFGLNKYNEKNLNDDFEVELNSVEESKNNESEEESEERKEKSFEKSSNNYFRDNFEEDKSDNDNDKDNNNNFDDFDNDDNKNDMDDENEEIKENDNSLGDGDNDNNDMDVDF